MAKATKKPVKKTSRKKSVAASSAPRASAAVSARSNRRFMEARFTEQTIYWLVIGTAVVALAAWVLSIQVQMNDLYDTLDIQNSQSAIPAKTAGP